MSDWREQRREMLQEVDRHLMPAYLVMGFLMMQVIFLGLFAPTNIGWPFTQQSPLWWDVWVVELHLNLIIGFYFWYRPMRRDRK